jgi:4-amino-4-deoxy-L-arabinose transferase-like glycosyltransferase
MSKKKMLVILLGICLLAFIVRMAFVGLFPALFSPDTPGYLEPAANLVAGRGYVTNAGVPYIAREPGYPALIALNYLLWGQSDYPVKVTQAALAALMCLPIFVIGQVVFDEAVGLLAALILALYPTLIPGVGFILTETFFTFLLSVAMALLVVFLQLRRWWVLGLAGITLGLAILTRSGLLIFPFLMALGFLVTARFKKQAVINSLLLLASTLVVVLPWTIRNYLAFGQFIPVHVAGGTSLYHGSHVIWQGDWWGGRSRWRLRRPLLAAKPTPSRSMRCWAGRLCKTSNRMLAATWRSFP